MTYAIGLDVGGTKIAGAVFNALGQQLFHAMIPTPQNYPYLIRDCVTLIQKLESEAGHKASVGIGLPGSIDRDAGVVVFAGNTPCLVGQRFRADMQASLQRGVRIANDADCAALSEVTDGAGAGYKNVFGLIIGTGVGGGLVVDGKLVQGVNGFTGEFGHLPLPYREEADGIGAPCHCKQKNCIEKMASGPALARFHHFKTGREADAETIAQRVNAGDAEATAVLDAFAVVMAKAIIPVIHMFDPDIIVASGGLSNIPRLFDQVPIHMRRYTFRPDIKTLFVPAKHGATSGLRGAAWLGLDKTQ